MVVDENISAAIEDGVEVQSSSGFDAIEDSSSKQLLVPILVDELLVGTATVVAAAAEVLKISALPKGSKSLLFVVYDDDDAPKGSVLPICESKSLLLVDGAGGLSKRSFPLTSNRSDDPPLVLIFSAKSGAI